jgi:malonyl-CoA decarboxylase
MVVEAPTPSLFDRYLGSLRRMWREVSGRLPGAIAPTLAPDLGGASAAQLRERMRECLAARGGEVSARARAADLGEAYLRLTDAGRKLFLSILAHDFDLPHEALAAAAQDYAGASDPEARRKLEARLREILTAPRVKLLTQFNGIPQGIKFLVDMRADLLKHVGDDPALAALETDMRQLLTSWFDVGFLDLKPITWDSAASLLEKLIAYEAVHKIQSWADLRNRLDSDRRCYAFFHPRMPGEPVIFVQVALVNGMSGSIQDLLDEGAPANDPRKADAAIFYSISNAQVGLRGIGFGNFLIKQVVDDVARQFPRIETFATLSPIPGFRRWLDRLDADALAQLVAPQRFASLDRALAARGAADLRALLAIDGWQADDVLAEAVREPLISLAAHYLLAVKREGRPADAVARFHLGNGAAVERLNWLGDRSAKGLAESAGLMVNYQYRTADIEHNHEAYAAHGTIAASEAVHAALARLSETPAESARFSFLGGHLRI